MIAQSQMNQHTDSYSLQERKLVSEVFVNLLICFTIFTRVIAIENKSSTDRGSNKFIKVQLA
jgi:hypothetical protein